jgi:hypothetical protein
MVSFVVIMSAEFGRGLGRAALAEQDQFGQSLVLGRADNVRKSIYIWASGRKRNGFHAASRQHLSKRCAEIRVAIIHNIAAGMKPQVSWVTLGRSAPSTLNMDGW